MHIAQCPSNVYDWFLCNLTIYITNDQFLTSAQVFKITAVITYFNIIGYLHECRFRCIYPPYSLEKSLTAYASLLLYMVHLSEFVKLCNTNKNELTRQKMLHS